jgi:hypothetical protein
LVKITIAKLTHCVIIESQINLIWRLKNMRVVIYDKESASLSVYNAGAIALDDGYIILGSPGWRGFFPLPRFQFLGLDERGLL